MTGKMIPFAGQNHKKSSAITDSGEFGNLKYEVYEKWNTIHFIESRNNKEITFKKDCDAFEEEFENICFNMMSNGDTAKIEGSGDNADLIISIKNGDLDMHLELKKMPGLRKFISLLEKSKKKVMGKKL